MKKTHLIMKNGKMDVFLDSVTLDERSIIVDAISIGSI